MCTDISNNRLLTAHYFNFIDTTAQSLYDKGWSCPTRVITRLFLLTVIPPIIVIDVLYTSLATVMIFPLYYLGSIQHLKTMATAWLLLPLTPVIMLLYLIVGKVDDIGCCETHPLLPLKMNQSQGRLQGLPSFNQPTAYPNTPLCRAIAACDWAAASPFLAENDEVFNQRIVITWNNGTSDAEYSVTLLEFMIFTFYDPSGLFADGEKYEHLWRILHYHHKTSVLLVSHNPALTPILNSFLKILINACNEEAALISDPCKWQSSLRFLLLAERIHKSLSQNPDVLDPSLLPIILKSYFTLAQSSWWASSYKLDWVFSSYPGVQQTDQKRSECTEKLKKMYNLQISAMRLKILKKEFPAVLASLIEEYTLDDSILDESS